MAEQDFTINIRTTASTAGIQQIQAALQGLGAQVQSINAAGGGGGGGGEDGGGLLDKAAAKIEHGIFRTAVHAIGIGVVYELVGGLMEATREIEKINAELNKQGDQLIKNAQLQGVQAKEATTHSDVLKITDATLKDIETTQKTLTELGQKELSYKEQFSDYLQKQMFARQKLAQMGDYEAARQAEVDTALSQYQQAKAKAIREVDDALKAQDRDIVQIINDTERALEVDKRRAAIAKARNEPKDYVEAIKSEQAHERELKAQREQRDKEVAAAQKTIQERFGLPGGQPVTTEAQVRGAELREQYARQRILSHPPHDLTPLEEKQGRDRYVANEKELRDKEVAAISDARDKQAEDIQKRYEEGVPNLRDKTNKEQSELLGIAKKILEQLQ